MRNPRKKRRKKKSVTPQEIFFRLLVGVLILVSIWVYEEWPSTELPSSEKPITLYAKEAKDDLRKTFLTAIQNAKKSIVLVMYTLHDNVMVAALRQKADEGIPIFVVVDAEGSPEAKEQLGPKVSVRNRTNSGIVHQKMLVIDDEQVWLGSANMTYSSLRLYGNLLFGMESPALASYVTAKAKSLPERGKGDAFRSRRFLLGEQEGEIVFLPDEKDAVDRVKRCIRSAQKTVRVAMFTFTREDLADELIDAQRRGVDTEVVIDQHQGRGTGAKLVEYLRKNGIPTRLSRGKPLLHHKFCYIDRKMLINGSANWTKAAFATNDDFFMIIDPLTQEQATKMDRIWKAIHDDSDL